MEPTVVPPYNVLIPGSYSTVNTASLTSAGGGTIREIPAILGVSKGGKPDTPLYFRQAGAAQNVLRGGALFDSVRLALIGGAPEVCAVRVGDSITQASITLKGETGEVLKLTARDWGEWANAITVSVAAGPILTVSYVAENGATYTQSWDFSALSNPTNAELAQAVNGELSPYAASPLVSAKAETGTGPLAVVTSKPLAGGTDGATPAAEDWASGLTVLETEKVSVIVAATSEKTVHAQVAEHVTQMSSVQARMERTAVYGGASGESETEAIARIKELPYARAQVVYPEQYLHNTKGELVLYDPFYVAAMVAGMHCAQGDVATSLLHKRTPAIEPGKQLSTIPGGAIETLLEHNITPLAAAPGGGVWVVDDLSGNTEPNGVFRDFATIREADYVAQYLRQATEPFAGGKSYAGSAESLQARAAQALADLVGVVISTYEPPTVELGPKQEPYVTPSNSYSISAPVVLIGTDKYIFIGVDLQAPANVIVS